MLAYPKGDLRRMLCVLAAIEELGEGARILRVARRTGLDNRTVTTQVEQAREQAGVVIEKEGLAYSIADWGPIIKKSGARQVLAELATPAMQAEISQALEQRENRRKQKAPEVG